MDSWKRRRITSEVRGSQRSSKRAPADCRFHMEHMEIGMGETKAFPRRSVSLPGLFDRREPFGFSIEG